MLPKNISDVREYDQDRDVMLPQVDVTKNYIVTNKSRGPVQLTLTNESGTETQTVVLTKAEPLEISGNRMTKYVWLLERERKIKIQIAHD